MPEISRRSILVPALRVGGLVGLFATGVVLFGAWVIRHALGAENARPALENARFVAPLVGLFFFAVGTSVAFTVLSEAPKSRPGR